MFLSVWLQSLQVHHKPTKYRGANYKICDQVIYKFLPFLPEDSFPFLLFPSGSGFIASGKEHSKRKNGYSLEVVLPLFPKVEMLRVF